MGETKIDAKRASREGGWEALPEWRRGSCEVGLCPLAEFSEELTG